ncbi:MAG: response regulator [Cyanothece sp. SIO1E1]|nr:response regulator [Cyanothece sp. SIO1E1]
MLTQQALILVVDDNSINVKVLFDALEEAGFRVLVAQSGASALEKLQFVTPDLILLDVMMPGIDGFETCRRLKSLPATQDTPVIFMTVLSASADKLQGFQAGAVDYITKPFQREEVLARVNLHLQLRSLNKNLEQCVAERTAKLTATLEHLERSNSELTQTLQQLKTTQNQLIQSEKMVTLGQLIAGVAHEINTPLGAIRASVDNTTNALSDTFNQLPELSQRLSPQRHALFFELINQALHQRPQVTLKEKRHFKRALKHQLGQYHPVNQALCLADTLIDIGIYGHIDPFLPLLREADADWILHLAYNLVRLQHNSQNILSAVERASKVVFTLKNYAHYDISDQQQLASITQGIDTALELYHNQLKHGVEVNRAYESLPAIWCYPDELIQIWTNLIHNAIQAMDNEGALAIQVSQQDQQVMVNITDSGCGISPDIQPRIFDPFFTTKPAGEGSGLGLDIVRKIVEKHNGTITVASVPGQTTFTVTIPYAPASVQSE